MLRDQVATAISILDFLDVHTGIVSGLGGGQKGLVRQLLLVEGTSNQDLHVSLSPNEPGYEAHATVAVIVSLLALVTGQQPIPGVAVVGECNMTGDIYCILNYPEGTDVPVLCRDQGIKTLVVPQVRWCVWGCLLDPYYPIFEPTVHLIDNFMQLICFLWWLLNTDGPREYR